MGILNLFFLIANVIGMARRGEAQINQTASSASPAPPCSRSSDTPETDAAKFLILSPLQSGTEEVVRAEVAENLESERNATKEQAMKIYENFKDDAAGYRRRIDELERAIRNLRDVSGRHHSQIAYERLFALLPENVIGMARRGRA